MSTQTSKLYTIVWKLNQKNAENRENLGIEALSVIITQIIQAVDIHNNITEGDLIN